MEIVAMFNNVMGTPKEVIVIESDDEDQTTESVGLGTNIGNNGPSQDGIFNIVAVYSLANMNNENINYNQNIISNEPDTEDVSLPKIVAVTSGIEIIHDDIIEQINNIPKNSDVVDDIVSDNDSNYTDVTDAEEDTKIEKPKIKYRKHKNIHIKNRIRNAINEKLQIFHNSKYYGSIKSYINTLPKRRKGHVLSIKKNVSRFNSMLPMKVQPNRRYQYAPIAVNKSCDSIRSGIMEQLKLFREKCFKQTNPGKTLEVMDGFLNTTDAEAVPGKATENDMDLDKATDITKDDSTVIFAGSESVQEEQSSTSPSSFHTAIQDRSFGQDEISPTIFSENPNQSTMEDNSAEKLQQNYPTMQSPRAHCSKELFPPDICPSMPSLPTVQLPESEFCPTEESTCNVKTHDTSKYKSLKYKQIKVETESSIPDLALVEETNNESSINLKDIVDDIATVHGVKDHESVPGIDDVFERLRMMRQSVGKIIEEDILSRLKPDRSQRDGSPEKSELDTELESILQLKNKSPKTSAVVRESVHVNEKYEEVPPVRIALPNGKLVKPKTLAEKRRLLRREFETEMRNRMQVNEQLLERQLLRQKSNNKRTESGEIREQLLFDQAPMTRASWKSVTEQLDSEANFKTQFMIVDGRYVRICGSRGGDERFLEPPPAPARLYKQPRKLAQRPALSPKVIPRFLPGPLSKKHLLVLPRLPPQDSDEYFSVKLPRVMLHVHPQAGVPLHNDAKCYLKLAFNNNIVDSNRARFAASAVVPVSKRSILKSETFSFPMPYRNNQEMILMRRLKTPTDIAPAVTIENCDSVVTPRADDKIVITDIMNDMFNYIETSLMADSLIQDDADVAYEPKTPPEKDGGKISTQEPTIAPTSGMSVKAALELRRLNVTVIGASERTGGATVCCGESYCRLGCVCSSLKCLAAGLKRHCGNVECMFECRCEYTHRLRQKPSLRQDLYTGIDEDDMLELKDRVRSGLAPVEAEFKHAVVVNDDQSVTLVDSDPEKRRRHVKAPKRFDDFVSSDLPCFSPITQLSPVKRQEPVEEIHEHKKSPKIPIMPKEELCALKVQVRLHNLALHNVEPWCMVHELYHCYCDCQDTHGEPFGSRVRKDSVEPVEEPEVVREERGSIKTLSRRIMLEVDENDRKYAAKKNWHVELFSPELEHLREKEVEVEQPQQVPLNKRKQSTTPTKSADSVLRRKSSDTVKRKYSTSNETDKDKQVTNKEKQANEVTKKPRLQVKSPWALNQMADKLAKPQRKISSDDSVLLREFEMSTKRVVSSDVEDEEDDSSRLLESIEDSIRLQRENLKISLQCARVDDPIKFKIQMLSEKNRKRAPSDRRRADIENNDQFRAKRLYDLVKNSQVNSQQRTPKTQESEARLISRISHNEEGNITIAHNQTPPPPPLIEARAPTKQIVNMVSSSLPLKDQKSMSTVVNREIIRMLNQKGALDASFDLAKPWRYRFQCMQWYYLLCKYRRGEVKLWLDRSLGPSSTMALLTTQARPPVPNCVDMSLLNAASENPNNAIHVPKFAQKIQADCKNLKDPKHRAQYVFMRAHPMYWSLEGVIERGQNKNKQQCDNVTIRPKSDLYAKTEIKPSVRENLAANGTHYSLEGGALLSRIKPDENPTQIDEKKIQKGPAKLRRSGTEIETSLIDRKKSSSKKIVKLNNSTESKSDASEESPVGLIPLNKRPRRAVTQKFYDKWNRGSVDKKSYSDSEVTTNEDSDSSKPKKKKKIDHVRKTSTSKENNEVAKNEEHVGIDTPLGKRPFTAEKVSDDSNNTTKNIRLSNDVNENSTSSSVKTDTSKTASNGEDKPLKQPTAQIDRSKTENPQVQIANVSSTDDKVPLAPTRTLEALPFIVGKRYLFVCMNETFSLLTSSRNGYRVTYLQLTSAIQAAISNNVYVRLKFKQNSVSNDLHGMVFAVPWCTDGVFIGPYGLTEQCMITKQIYCRNKLIGLSDYARTVEKREPKPVGYWMCYYGDDQKFIRSYQSLMMRLGGSNNKKSEILQRNHNDAPPSPKKVILNLKGTSPNSVLKTNLDKIRAKINGNNSNENQKEVNKIGAPLNGDDSNEIRKEMKKLPPLLPVTALRPTKSNITNSIKTHPMLVKLPASVVGVAKDGDMPIIRPMLLRPIDATVLKSKVPALASNAKMLNADNSPENHIGKSGTSLSTVGTESISDQIATAANAMKIVDEANVSRILNNWKKADGAADAVIALSSDSEEEREKQEKRRPSEFGAPGPRWLYSDVSGIGYLEVQALSTGMLSIRLPMVNSTAAFENFKKATHWINSILRKIVYILPNTFLPTWAITTKFCEVKHMSKMNQDIFQGNYVIYDRMLIDLSNQKNIDQLIKKPRDHLLATKYAEHYISRYIKHALGLKFTTKLDQVELAEAACTEIKSINDLEAKLVDQKKLLLKTRENLVRKLKKLDDPTNSPPSMYGDKCIAKLTSITSVMRRRDTSRKALKVSGLPSVSEKALPGVSDPVVVIDD